MQMAHYKLTIIIIIIIIIINLSNLQHPLRHCPPHMNSNIFLERETRWRWQIVFLALEHIIQGPIVTQQVFFFCFFIGY